MFNECTILSHLNIWEINKIIGPSNEEGKLKWIPKSDINQLNMLEGDKIFMEWMTKYNFFTARFTYKDDELIDYSLDTII